VSRRLVGDDRPFEQLNHHNDVSII